MSLEWPPAHTQRGPLRFEHSLSQDDANNDCPGNAHLDPTHRRWRRDVLQPPDVLRSQETSDTCVHIVAGGLRCVSCNARGLFFFSDKDEADVSLRQGNKETLKRL